MGASSPAHAGRGQAGPPKAGIRAEGRWKLLAYCYSIAGIAGGTTTGPVAPAGGLPKDWPGGNDTVVLFDLEADPGETTSVAAHHPDVVARLTARLAAHAAASVEPMQWDPPFQGPDYKCASCPLRPAVASPFDAWTPWMDPAPISAPLSRVTVPFQYNWRFHYGDDPSSPPGAGPGSCSSAFEDDLADRPI